MKGFLLVCTGGCRSGKSEYARQWVEARGLSRVYIATAREGEDAEMARRIAAHRQMRQGGWVTYEAAGNWHEPERLVAAAAAMGEVLLFDCLTLWTALCLEQTDAAKTLELTRCLLTSFGDCGKPVALVTNELGMGLVPDNALGRLFRDTAGLVNQEAASCADAAVFLVSGLPLTLKGNPATPFPALHTARSLPPKG